jgi:hypothetical protein
MKLLLDWGAAGRGAGLRIPSPRRHPSMEGRAVGFLDGIRAVDRELHPPPFDPLDIRETDKVMVALVTRIVFAARELDAAAFDPVDRADMKAIGTNDLGMFANFGWIDHGCISFAGRKRRAQEKDANADEKIGRGLRKPVQMRKSGGMVKDLAIAQHDNKILKFINNSLNSRRISPRVECVAGFGRPRASGGG